MMSTRQKPTSQGLRVASYGRVSSSEQVDTWSLDAQRSQIYEFCQNKGWYVVEEYIDEGHSAWGEKADTRPEYQRMLVDAQDHKFDVIVTHSIDRMSRSLVTMMKTLSLLNQCDISFVSLSEEMDFATPSGKIMMAMFAIFAEVYSDSVSRHTKKGHRQRKLSGLPTARPPFGYQLCDDSCLDTDDSHQYCHVNEEKAVAVRQMFRRYSSGTQSMQRIADWLNSQGYRTNGFKPDKVGSEKGANFFTSHSVSDILRNPFYIGHLRDDAQVVNGAQQAIVEEALFYDVQKRLEENARQHAHVGRRPISGRVLKGLARCFRCAGKFQATLQGTQKRNTYLPDEEKSETSSLFVRRKIFCGKTCRRGVRCPLQCPGLAR